MTSICLYFQVHQPFRLNWFWPEAGKNWNKPLTDLYFDNKLNEQTFKKVAGKCYHKANDIILSQIDRFKKDERKFKVSFSLSGTFLDQCERWDKDLLEKFRQMAESGCAEFLCETYYHSLASLYEDRTEFTEQVEQHKRVIKDLLGQNPKVFRNTELLYHNGIAEEVERMGFQAMMTEGIERILEGWKSPNYIYQMKDGKMKILLRNYRLSDDIGYRFSSKDWSEYPLTAEKYSSWLSASQGTSINVFIDYETFGEHQWEDTGIFWFLGALPQEVLKWQNLQFATPSEVSERYPAVGEIDVPYYETVSWADLERDASAWLGNHMQHLAFNQIKSLENLVKKTGSMDFLKTWRYLQTGDHFYYMCTKCLADGDVHKYFSHHGNPYDAGINYMAVLSDFKEKINNYLYEKEERRILEEIKRIQEAIEIKESGKESEEKGVKNILEKKGLSELRAELKQLIESSKNIKHDQKLDGTVTYGRKYSAIDKYAPQMIESKTAGALESPITKGKRVTAAEKYGNPIIKPESTLTPRQTVIKGKSTTAQEKYALKYRTASKPEGEHYLTTEKTKNSQVTKPKKITPQEKYKPKD